jgi:glycosyltransferase involved in cell wall biosynthesis
LIGALDLLRQSQPQLAGRIHVLQVGRVDRYVAQQFTKLAARFQVSVLPPVTHPEAIAYMLGADLLYLPTTHVLVPGKTYEYLRSGTPTLALGGGGSHLQSLLAETGGGVAIDHGDLDGIARFIEQCMRQPDHPRPTVPSALARYSRAAAAEKLAVLLDDVITTAAH